MELPKTTPDKLPKVEIKASSAPEAFPALAPQLQEGGTDKRTPAKKMLDWLVDNKKSLFPLFTSSPSRYESGLEVQREPDGSYIMRLNQKEDWDEQLKFSPDGQTVTFEVKEFDDPRDRSHFELIKHTGKTGYVNGKLSFTAGLDFLIAPDGSYSESGTGWIDIYSGDGKFYSSTRCAQDGSIDSAQYIIYNPGARGWYKAPDGTRILLTPQAIELQRDVGLFPLPNGKVPGTIWTISLSDASVITKVDGDVLDVKVEDGMPDDIAAEQHICRANESPFGGSMGGPKPQDTPEMVIRPPLYEGGKLEVVASFDVEYPFFLPSPFEYKKKGVKALSVSYTRKR
jgi:hypothetical protein